MRSASHPSPSRFPRKRTTIEGDVHPRDVRVDTSGAETIGLLFLLLICLVAVLTSLSTARRNTPTPAAPATPPHAAALSAP